MEIIATWLVMSVIVAAQAGRAGRSVIIWFVVGVLMSPLLAGVMLFGFGPIRRTAQTAG